MIYTIVIYLIDKYFKKEKNDDIEKGCIECKEVYIQK